MRIEDLSIPDGSKEKFLERGIEELNPPQEKAVEAGVLEGNSMVVASPTASGKTLISELAFLKRILEDGKKCVYIVPLRALAQEKYKDFREYEDLGMKVAVSVGDYDSSSSWLGNYDLIITTSEKLDSILRHSPSWVQDLGLIVSDEIHLLNDDSRGPTLEVTLTRLMQLTEAQILGLSATISNADEIAGWLDAELVKSNYRPVQLYEGVYDGNCVRFFKKDDLEFGRRGRGELLISDHTLEIDKQALIFASSRRNAESIAEKSGKKISKHLSSEEKKKLKELAGDILDVPSKPTKQCKRLAKCVRMGTAFHHAGLCVTGDTVLMKENGTFAEIQNFVENDEDSNVLGIEEGKIQSTNVNDKLKLNEKPVLKFKTRTGKEIKVSKNHPLLTVDSSGLEWKKSNELNEGDYIATPQSIEVNTSYTLSLRDLIPDSARTFRKYEKVKEIWEGAEKKDNSLEIKRKNQYCNRRNISVGDFRKLCSAVNENPSKHLDKVISVGGHRPTSIPEKINRNFMWFVGAIAGDGNINRGAISFHNNSHKLQGKFKEIVKNLFRINIGKFERKDGRRTSKINSKVLVDILTKEFGLNEGKKSHKIKFPEVPLTKELLSGYLSGLFDTDGSVSFRKNEEGSPCVEFYTTSRRFIKELQISLLRFGIQSYTDTRKAQGRGGVIGERKIKSKNDVQRLTIYGVKNLLKFKKQIGFENQKKKEKLKKIIEKNPPGGRNQLDIIPSKLGTLVKSLREGKEFSLDDLEPEAPKATLSRYENGKTPMKRGTFQKLAKKLESKKLLRIANNDIYWDKIVSKKELGENKKLYDLSTETQNFLANGIIAHNTSEQRHLIEDAFKDKLIRIISATPTLAMGINMPAYRVLIRDAKRYYPGKGMEYIPVLEYSQMVGRAGRPDYDPHGEAILIGKDANEAQELEEKFVDGEPEEIYSKLAVEPVLRTHILSLIASRVTRDEGSLQDFMSKTFFYHQYGDMQKLGSKVERILKKLERQRFITWENDRLKPTRVGKRVAELYLDPESAHRLIGGLESSRSFNPFGLLVLICDTTEMRNLRMKSREFDEIQDILARNENKLIKAAPSPWDLHYDDFMNAVKTAAMMNDWIDEAGEDKLMEKYGETPGGLRGKQETADWLLYSLQEIAHLLNKKEKIKEIRKLRLRIKYGVEKELLPLVKLKGIGRVRARKLWKAGYKSLSDLRSAPSAKLKEVLGPKTGDKVKKQLKTQEDQETL